MSGQNSLHGALLDAEAAPRILLVDDEPAKLLTYETILGGIDATLVRAASAHEALDHLLRSEFAVVLVDVCMPDLDGFELAEMIRDHPRCKHTAIIFVSGVHLSELDRLKGYQRGAVDYLQVPVVPEILRAKVNAFVDLYRTTRELAKLNRELEARVAQRTMELEDSVRAKDEFLAVLAHELRNPLAAIRSAAHVIALPAVPPAIVAKSTAVIERQVEHLVRLVDDLVDLSRITRGMVELRRQTVDMGQVIARAVEAARPLIESRGHTFDVDVPAEPLVVDGDPARLTQVLVNILNNAAKFTEPGGRVSILVRRQDGEVMVKVSDTGIGIAPDLLPRVFEMFMQGQRPLDRASTGLGIGLSLVRRLVDMHGGHVTIHSDGPGCGAAVTFRLPLVAALLPAAAELPLVEVKKTADALRILVVDDNVDAAEVLAARLRLAGHDVLTADNGLEALRLGETFAPQAALIDLGMPQLNGYDTARRIRQRPWGRRTALVAVTGWGQQRDRDSTRLAGFDAHLVKPVSDRDLMESLVGLHT